MKGLFARLRSIGLSTPYVRKFLLPDWWEDEAAETPTGFTEAVWTVARHLGVEPQQLLDGSEAIALPRRHNVKFKLAQGADEQSVELARTLGEQVVRFTLLGVERPEGATREGAQQIRSRILDAGAPWVGFGALLDYCWDVGIPVLHLAEFPKGATKKMDGLAVNIGGQAAIVLASGRASASWLLFHLAHELAHILRGHVDDGGTVVDGAIDQGSSDPLEKEANDFAIELITGQVGTTVAPTGRWPDAPALAMAAQHLGEQISVDPGHLVLNYAHSMRGNFWGVANAALKRLPNEGDPAAMIRERLAANLDWSALPPEAAEFVARMTRLDIEAAT